MKKWIEAVLERYGQTVTLERQQRTAQAFLQPVTARNEQTAEDFSGIGWLDGRLWLYLGAAELETGDTLAWNGMRFRVRSCRAWAIGGTVLYWWASLEREKETA